MLRKITLGVLLFVVLAGPTLADDWIAVRLRGVVQQFVDGTWQTLNRNDVVPDSRMVRTLATGHVDFVRGEETVSVDRNTQIQIYDRGGAKPFTTVKQYFGTVSIEAEVQNVEHFAVQTPYLAAVVKGTRFTVTSNDQGASVEVRRGHVAVEEESDHSHVTINAGQSVTLTVSGGEVSQLQVSGRGDLPVVLDANGNPIGSAPAASMLKSLNSDKSSKTNNGIGLALGNSNGNGNGNGNPKKNDD